MIEFENVSKQYDNGHLALNNVSFHIRRGEMAFLTGHSGAGKSTLLKLVMMMDRASRGLVTVDGEDLGRLGRGAIPFHRRKIGFVFQDHQLLFDRSVIDNVALPLVIAGFPHREIPRRDKVAIENLQRIDRPVYPGSQRIP